MKDLAARHTTCTHATPIFAQLMVQDHVQNMIHLHTATVEEKGCQKIDEKNITGEKWISIHDVTAKKLTFVVNCRMRYFKRQNCLNVLNVHSGLENYHHIWSTFLGAISRTIPSTNRLDPRRKHTTIGAHGNVVGQRKLGRTNALFCGLFHGATLMTISVHLGCSGFSHHIYQSLPTSKHLKSLGSTLWKKKSIGQTHLAASY